MSEVLDLPKPKMQKKKKSRGLTSRAQCIKDADFLKKLKTKEQEKIDKKEAKEAQKTERERAEEEEEGS